MDGNGSLFGTLSGNTRNILGKFTVELPKKHGRGGQSALRFARLRMEKRHNYVRKVSTDTQKATCSIQIIVAHEHVPNLSQAICFIFVCLFKPHAHTRARGRLWNEVVEQHIPLYLCSWNPVVPQAALLWCLIHPHDTQAMCCR